jgi:hypothetical protein
MRWKTETQEERDYRLRQWKRWFAWRPVVIDGERVWLEYVYRRTKVYYGGMGDTLFETEYADLVSMLRKQQAEHTYDGLE